jgi:outer membrane protein assembly factor BamA
MHRPKIYAYHSLGFAFKSIQLADSALAHQGNNPYLWQGLSNQNEVNVSYQFNLDKRNFKGYPTKGYLIKGQLDNTTLFAEHSNLNYWQLKGSVSNYWPLGNRLFLAVAAMAKYSNNAFLPYNKFQSLGYGKDYIRGYELYVIDGHAFGLTKAEFKWQLLQKNYRFLPKVKHYEQLPVKVFWTIFNDWTYVRNERQFIQPNNNVLPNQYLYGIGTGINLLFYSDYCARIEYSQNKMGWDRLYLSFVTAF